MPRSPYSDPPVKYLVLKEGPFKWWVYTNGKFFGPFRFRNQAVKDSWDRKIKDIVWKTVDDVTREAVVDLWTRFTETWEFHVGGERYLRNMRFSAEEKHVLNAVFSEALGSRDND